MSLKIFSYPNNWRVWKAQIAGKYNGVQIETPAFNFGVDNKTPEFLKKNPLGKVPVLETPEGSIFESNAIARYVARANPNTKLFGANNYENGLVDQWIDFSVGEIDLPTAVWVYPILGFIPNNKTATDKAKGDIRKVLGVLNEHLLTRTFLVGNRVTLADIVVGLSLFNLYKHVLDPGFRKPFVNTNRWFTTLVNQPEWKAVIGDFKLCEKMEVAKEAPKTEAPKEAPKKEEKKPQEAKPKAAPKPKPKDDDEEEDEEKEEKKAPNPLDSLPPSKMPFDEWKRTYSNTDTRGEALPYFWKKWDEEGAKNDYSLWHCVYKYNNENKVLFMTLNLLNGFIQRLDKLRKYGFGSLLIFGEEGENYEISGVWCFRGLDIPQEMKDVDDYVLYDWRKIDPSNPADKKLVEDYWAWNGDFDGKGSKFHDQGKVFK